MSAPGTHKARGRRHPMPVVTRAQELARAGWTHSEVRDILAREGVSVDPKTVARWTDPLIAWQCERNADSENAKRAAINGSKPAGRGNERPEYKLARMRALREKVGLKDAQIARLMAFDFGDALNNEMVGRALESNLYPPSLS